MTIKSHIAISATISLALIALIACQQKTQAPKEQSKAVTEQKTKVEEAMKNFEQEAKAETEKLESKVEQAAKEFNDKAKEAEDKAKEETKEIETKVDEAAEKVESEVKNIENTTESKEEQEPKNLLVNSDFSDEFNGWNRNKGVSIIEIDGKKCVESIGPTKEKEQTRIWQAINTTSGHVYRLSFKLKADQKGAFAIFRDNQNNKERYLFAESSESWKEYSKDFKASKTGEYALYFSCNAPGNFYFSDMSLIDIGFSKE